MARPRGSRNKSTTALEEKPRKTTVTTTEELSLLQALCFAFEKLNDEQRSRTMDFFIHKYREYLPIEENK